MSTAPDPAFLRRRHVRGLTLLEVVVGLAILSLMAGAIYAIVLGAIESTTSLQAIQAEDRRLETMLERTRLAFSHLPVGATVELRLLENEPPRQELVLRGVSSAFAWGDRSNWATAVVTLAPQPWPEERIAAAARPAGPTQSASPTPNRPSTLALSVPDFFRTDAEGEPLPDSPVRSRQGHQFLRPDAQGRFWFDLLPEVDRIEWRFYDASRKIWVDQLPAGRPPMIELRVTLPGRTSPVRAIFATT